MKFWAPVISLLMLLTTADSKGTGLTIDFGLDQRVNDWYVVTDRVMGGRSNSKIQYAPKSLVFSGYVSLENNGGFASIRSQQQELDLSSFTVVEITFRTSDFDRIFALRLNTNTRYYRPSYNQYFSANSADWQTRRFKLLEFKETILGRSTGNTLPLDKLKDILRVGIMLNDKKEGNFSLEIDSIRFQ